MSARRRAPSILALAAAAILAAPAAAKERMDTHWVIKPGQAPAEAIRARPGDVILRQRLLPSGLAILKEAYSESGAARTLAPGAQLFKVNTNTTAAIYCSMVYRGPSTIVKILSPLPSGTHLCFIDRDGDSRFEMSFVTADTVGSLPSVYGSIPPSDKQIAPIAYKVADPERFEGDYAVAIRYDRKTGAWREFGIEYGAREAPAWLDRQAAKKVKTLPVELDLLGARLIIREAVGNEIVVEVARAMPEQPFGIIKSVVYY